MNNNSMCIYIPNTSKQSIGGGWTFLNNFKKASENKFVNSWQESDLILITGATMTDRNEIQQAKQAGKPVIFRVDNIPKDTRNRGTAFSRMLDFAKLADFIIFQSEWAKDYAGWWFEKNGIDITNRSVIVYNGVDTDYFYPKEEQKIKGRYLYVQYNRDENKRPQEAFYRFHQEWRKDDSIELWVVGRFSPESIQYNFDFFANENVSYIGIIEDRNQLADIYRTAEYLLFPAFADASPNTVMESIACGCKVVGINDVGGTKELVEIKNRTIQDMAKDYQDVFNKVC